MHNIKELPAWERMSKEIVLSQIGEITGQHILDFGSGEGVIANHYAQNNDVIAIEPCEEMLKNRWADYSYQQIKGDVSSLKCFADNSFDMVICHNVLEYADDKPIIVNELCRVLKKGGKLSILKHNRAGRIMQMAVLLDDFDKANDLLDGKDSTAAKFGSIKYYEDDMLTNWNSELKLINTYGIRTFWDLQQNQEKHKTEKWQEKMIQLEKRVSQISEFREIAFFHHLIFTKM